MSSTPIVHAQFGEDRLLLEIFSDTTTGVCMEVGAFDGVAGSATLAFEQLGWTTILVEPLPELAAKIRACRKGRLFEAAAGPVNGDVMFKRALHDAAISTLADTQWQRQLYTLRHESWEEIPVRQLTLDTILEQSGATRVDFVIIDVEGFEPEVLRGWDIARWQPRVIILEDNSRGLDLGVARHLAASGYVCFNHTGVNDWYARATDRALATWSACRRQWLRRRLRRARAWAKRLAPKSLTGLLRRAGLAGE
jgi:FkbM family methyltransferase